MMSSCFIFSVPAVYFANANTLTNLSGFLTPYRRPAAESPTMNGYEMEDMSMKGISNGAIENGANKKKPRKKHSSSSYDLGIYFYLILTLISPLG